jgi:hypothetical protein
MNAGQGVNVTGAKNVVMLAVPAGIASLANIAVT